MNCCVVSSLCAAIPEHREGQHWLRGDATGLVALHHPSVTDTTRVTERVIVLSVVGQRDYSPLNCVLNGGSGNNIAFDPFYAAW